MAGLVPAIEDWEGLRTIVSCTFASQFQSRFWVRRHHFLRVASKACSMSRRMASGRVGTSGCRRRHPST